MYTILIFKLFCTITKLSFIYKNKDPSWISSQVCNTE